MYVLLLAIGAVGLLAQALLGLGHSGGHHHAGDHGGGHHADHGGHHGGHHGDHAHAPLWASLLSPLTLFAVALGAGTTGLSLAKALREPLLAFVAAAGGLLFNALLVRPLFRAVLDFGSTPAAALEGAVLSSAEAVSRFDEHGRGVVRLTIDGQSVRLLARLDAHDLGDAPHIAPGDALTVTEVDPARNACRVARL